MGKGKKARKSHRFNPIGRPGDNMDVDGATESPKQVNAHQARHIERKRLQAEMKGVRSASRKVSKGNKNTMKAQKKELRQSMQTLKAKASSLRNSDVRQEQPAEEADAPEAPDSVFTFDLPDAIPIAKARR